MSKQHFKVAAGQEGGDFTPATFYTIRDLDAFTTVNKLIMYFVWQKVIFHKAGSNYSCPM